MGCCGDRGSVDSTLKCAVDSGLFSLKGGAGGAECAAASSRDAVLPGNAPRQEDIARVVQGR